jgi:hypothetical protein
VEDVRGDNAMITLTPISSILSLISLLIAILVGIGTLRQRAKEPDTKRWKELMDWRLNVDEQIYKIDKRISRDYTRLNDFDIAMGIRIECENIILESLKAIIDHLSTGNSRDEMKKISQGIDNFMREERKKRAKQAATRVHPEDCVKLRRGAK